MESNYIKIYTGSFIISQLIITRLQEIGISPVVKDESESGRLAGFGAAVPGNQELYVRNEELDKATSVVSNAISEMSV